MSTEYEKQRRTIDEFDYLELSEHHECELIVTKDVHESLVIEAPAEIIDRIETKVEDRKLIIKTGGSFFQKIGDSLRTSLNRHKIKYHLTVSQLFGMELKGIVKANVTALSGNYFVLKFNGVGNVNFKELKAQFLEVKLTNLGKIVIHGEVGEQKVSIKGSSNYQAGDLKSSKSTVTLNGIGKAEIWVEDELEAKIQGIGNISYYGKPEIKANVSPGANLINLGVKNNKK